MRLLDKWNFYFNNDNNSQTLASTLLKNHIETQASKNRIEYKFAFLREVPEAI